MSLVGVPRLSSSGRRWLGRTAHKTTPGRRARSDADGHVHERLRGVIDLDPDAVGNRHNGVHAACQRLRGPHAEVAPGPDGFDTSSAKSCCGSGRGRSGLGHIVVDRGCHS